MFIDIPGK